MKLAQRIVIGFYIYKFRILALFSTKVAARAAFHLFCTPYTKRKNYNIPKIFLAADKLTLDLDGLKINGFRWIPKENSNGKKILICHGFDSYSYKFDRYVGPLLKSGFEVLAFDAPAHGTSSGKTIKVTEYRKMILTINGMFGPVDNIMAHSFGALAVALAAEELEDAGHKKLALIAPATETTFAIDTFFKHVSVSKKVRLQFDKLIEDLGGNPASWYSVARVMQKINVPTLWVHDRDDAVTPYEHVHYLVEKKLPHIQFEITSGLGHSNIYKDNKVKKRIIEFLSAP
ncbi:MAG TPA: alpha/beta fold hydrolase [Segetibacter sp.]|jgi:pimeloyl-ACP methyl ester carboxylesterase